MKAFIGYINRNPLFFQYLTATHYDPQEATEILVTRYDYAGLDKQTHLLEHLQNEIGHPIPNGINNPDFIRLEGVISYIHDLKLLEERESQRLRRKQRQQIADSCILIVYLVLFIANIATKVFDSENYKWNELLKNLTTLTGFFAISLLLPDILKMNKQKFRSL